MAGVGPSGANSAVSVGASAVSVASARLARNGLVIQNAHASNTLYLGADSNVTTSNGLKVVAGGSCEFPDYQGAVYGIASGASTDVRVFEVF